MQKFLLLLFLLISIGYTKAESPLTPVIVDAAAAYPAQTLGTRPPVLIGTKTLSKEQLDGGYILLFDGVSNFGWTSDAENGMLPIMANPKIIPPSMTHRITGSKVVVNSHGTVDFIYDKSLYPTCSFSFAGAMGGGRASVGTNQHDTVVAINNQISLHVALAPRDVHPFSIPNPNSRFPTKSSDGYAIPLHEGEWKSAVGDVQAIWDGNMTVKLLGGSGMVETVQSFGDFVLQLEYKTDKPVNSGVFFRCIPSNGDPKNMMNGYECQIYNNPPAEDYEMFIGTDTGGLFRRQVGRNVGAKDGEWNYLTIIARGPMMATWVNGIQVTDWKDARRECIRSCESAALRRERFWPRSSRRRPRWPGPRRRRWAVPVWP